MPPHEEKVQLHILKDRDLYLSGSMDMIIWDGSKTREYKTNNGYNYLINLKQTLRRNYVLLNIGTL